ncbi:hypothetical protein KBI52_01625 [Microvirga sp. HBU67558]|nr:hypothetical protein [Microvirga sp. HBU67558]
MGTYAQAIGRSRGGLTTKIVALLDRLVDLHQFPGQQHDSIGAQTLLEGIEIGALITDKGFDTDALRPELDPV